MELATVTDAIFDGEFDEGFDAIRNAIENRRDMLTMKKASSFRIGDKVMFTGRPKYLHGCTAIIEGKKKKNFIIRFDVGQPVGKYVNLVTCPPSILERVSS